MARRQAGGSRARIGRVTSGPAAKAGKTTQAAPSPSTPAALDPNRYATFLLTAGLLACATLPYLNILFNGFVYDDDFQILRNPYIRNFHHLKKIFTGNVWSFEGPAVSNYHRPMMSLGYIVCYKIFGLHPYGFHLVSLILHALIVLLVLVLAERLTGDRTCAFVAAAFFALHPIHSEPVAWIAAVTEPELALFYLITFWLFLTLAKPGGRLSGRRLGAMIVTFILALLSKEQAMTLPLLAMVYEHFYREDRFETTTSQKLARYGALWLAGAAYLLVRIHFLGKLAPVTMFGQVISWQIVLSATALVGEYVWKLIWPVRLCIFYAFHPSTSFLDLHVLAGIAVLLALAVLFRLCWRSNEPKVRIGSFAVIWFLATLSPVLNAHWMGDSVFTERYLYLPSVGVAWLLGLGATKLWTRAATRLAQRRALALIGVMLGALYTARIVIRDRDWNNDSVLYTRTLASVPEPLFYLNLGRALADEGRVDEAIAQYVQALRIKPDFPDGHYNLGYALASQGRLDEAIAQYSEALRSKPDYAEALNNLGLALARQGRIDSAMTKYSQALHIDPDAPVVHNNLALALAGQGRLDEAVAQYSEALRGNPDYPEAHYNLALVLARQGKTDEAAAQFSEALRLKPDFPEAHNHLGLALAGQGRFDEAKSEYWEALRLKPDDAEAHNNLGLALVGQGRIDEAEAEYLEALRIKPDFAEAHNNLGVALTRQGRIDEAKGEYLKALQLNPDYAEAHNNLGVALGREGEFVKAGAQFSEAVRTNPNLLDARLNLALALANQGKIDEAIAQLSQILRIKPDFTEAQRLLNDLSSRAKPPTPHIP